MPLAPAIHEFKTSRHKKKLTRIPFRVSSPRRFGWLTTNLCGDTLLTAVTDACAGTANRRDHFVQSALRTLATRHDRVIVVVIVVVVVVIEIVARTARM
jgi:hypothetical protein